MQNKNDEYVFVQLKPSKSSTINPKVDFNFKIKKKLKVINLLTVLISQLQLKPDASIYLYKNRRILKPLKFIYTLIDDKNDEDGQ